MSAASAIQVGRVTSGGALSLKAFLTMLGRAFRTAEVRYPRSAERRRAAGNPDHSFQMSAHAECDAVLKRLYDAWLV